MLSMRDHLSFNLDQSEVWGIVQSTDVDMVDMADIFPRPPLTLALLQYAVLFFHLTSLQIFQTNARKESY